jgi:hypothetical protein
MPKVAKIFLAVIVLLLLWSTISYIRNPAPYKALFGGVGGTGGVRAYYSIFVCCIVFWTCFRLFACEELNLNLLLATITITSLVIGFLRILGHFFMFDLPLDNSFKHAAESTTNFGVDVHRIGGIDLCIQVGIAALFGFYYMKRKTSFLFPLLFLFFTLSFFGGGRTIFASILLATILYFFIINRKKAFIASIAILCFFLIYNLLNPYLDLPPQFNRLLSFESSGRIYQFNDPRSELFSEYLKTFSENPFLGKGISYFNKSTRDDFIKSNLAIGGHNAYLSTLAIFGIAGGLFLAVMLLGTIFVCITTIKRFNNTYYKQFMIFLLIISTIQCFYSFTGGSGYKDILLYFMAGSAIGVHTIQFKHSQNA